MATTISTASAEVAERLKIVVGTGARPTDLMIQGFVREGFNDLWAILRPVFRGAFTVNSANGVTTVSTDLESALYVTGPREIYVPGAEWVETEDGINFRHAGDFYPATSDTVLVWYTTVPTDFSSASSIESTCIFGPDWLQPGVLMYAEIQSLKRMSRVHDSAGSASEAAAWVTIQQEYQRFIERRAGERARELAFLEQRMLLRFQARGIQRENAIQSWNNESNVRNTLTDAYTGPMARRERYSGW